MSHRPRMSLQDAIKLCTTHKVRIRRKWDGHWLFFLPGNQTVSIADGRKDTVVPPRLALYLDKLCKGASE